MYQRGRHPVAVQDTELLFARWFSDHMDGDGKPRAENLIAPDQSMNRSGLGGRCWYVLVPDPTDEPAKAMKTLCRGIVRVAAPDLSMQMVADGKVFTLRIEPDPLDHNYHHCELHLFRDGQRLSAREVRDLKGDDRKSWKAAKGLVQEPPSRVTSPATQI
jgi:hypothetical protein